MFLLFLTWPSPPVSNNFKHFTSVLSFMVFHFSELIQCQEARCSELQMEKWEDLELFFLLYTEAKLHLSEQQTLNGIISSLALWPLLTNSFPRIIRPPSTFSHFMPVLFECQTNQVLVFSHFYCYHSRTAQRVKAAREFQYYFPFWKERRWLIIVVEYLWTRCTWASITDFSGSQLNIEIPKYELDFVGELWK